MHKSKVLEVASLILLISTVIFGIISFKFGKEIKQLRSEVYKTTNINKTLNIENEKLKEQNKSNYEELEDEKKKLRKYQKLLETTLKENDKVYSDLDDIIKKHKTTIKQVEVTLNFVNNKIEENKENESIINILKEVKSSLESIANND